MILVATYFYCRSPAYIGSNEVFLQGSKQVTNYYKYVIYSISFAGYTIAWRHNGGEASEHYEV